MNTTPPELTALLTTGEKILWSGQPRPSVFIVRGLPNLGYGVAWGVLGAFWYYGSGGIGQYSAFYGWWRLVPLLSLPFILTGFSFFFYPIRLGALARRTWYVVTDRRVFIAELPRGAASSAPPTPRFFSRDEMAGPDVRKRIDGLYDVILTKRALDNPHLVPRLDAGFFGIADGEAAATAINAARV
jgi:hypothetical protein